MAVKITEQPYGVFEGREVKKYLITQIAGIQVGVINYGATITNIIVPDTKGVPGDVVLGFENLEGYIKAGNIYAGAICGRYANRIAEGSFNIGNQTYSVSKNEEKNMLHGGHQGFDKVFWDARILSEIGAVEFSYRSIDGEEGFPGNLEVEVIYKVIDNKLEIEYKAITDKATPVNLTSHCYFNLSCGNDENIMNHELSLNADSFVEINKESIPTGKLLAVDNTIMDFRKMKMIGSDSDLNAFDQTWVLNESNDEMTEAARLCHKNSGRMITVSTSKPGIHFYNGFYLDGNYTFTKKGQIYHQYAGLCLETQYFPDSPNHKEFPQTILFPGDIYKHKTIYNFSSITNY